MALVGWLAARGRVQNSRRGRGARFVKEVLAVVLGALLVPVVATTARADAPTVAFDWSMPARFGPDRNGDGVIDYVDGATDRGPTGYDANPSSWHVDLNACASNASSDAVYAWTVVDQPDPATPITVQGGPDCDAFWMEVPEEGTYRVRLQVTDGDLQSVVLTKQVVVQDWLIVALGDSYGSGEGSPDIPIDNSQLQVAETAWANVSTALANVFQVEADMSAVNVAIAEWLQAQNDVAQYCGDVTSLECIAAAAIVIAKTAQVIAALAVYAWNATVETIGDAQNAVASIITAAHETLDAVKLVADEITGQISATWQDQQCHRSAKAGSALAAKKIEDEDPHTSVTFVHLACSGATMTYGLLGNFEGTEPAPDPNNPGEKLTNAKCDADGRPDGWVAPVGCVPPQVDVAKQLVGNREVDGLYLSIGGNDAHFADILIACMVLEPCDDPNALTENPGAAAADAVCPLLNNVPLLTSIIHFARAQCDALLRPIDPLDTATQLVDEGVGGDVRPPINKMFPGLAVAYGRLATKLTGTTEDPGLVPAGDSQRVFLSHYVDAIKSDDGSFCDWDSMGLASIPRMSAYESEHVIDDYVIPHLFDGIEAATVAHGWTYVDGVYSRFTNHGYCASDHYLNRLQETFPLEGRVTGMVHPNYAGHRAYRDAIYEKLQPSLYAGGDVNQPRRPRQAPYADAGSSHTVTEGSSVTLTNNSWDSNSDPLTFAWSHNRAGKVSLSSTTSSAPDLTGIDDTTGTVSVTVSDADGSRTDSASFTVDNADPEVGTISGLTSPVARNTSATASAPFSDAGVSDTHTVSWDWGDGTTSAGTVTESGGSGTASGTHTYSATGIYTVTATVTDDDGGSDTATHEYAAVYDPAGGFVTGAGWFNSPSGAYTPGDATDPDVQGQAQFAFVSKYQKGSSVPLGNTSFRFNAADLQFASTSYDWMVISSSKATYRGLGTVNGVAGYRFMIAAIDGGSGGVDKLRVRIWDSTTGVVLYDNQPASALDGAPNMAIGAGAITVQGPK